MVPALFECLLCYEIDRPAENQFQFLLHLCEVKKSMQGTGFEIYNKIDIAFRSEIFPGDRTKCQKLTDVSLPAELVDLFFLEYCEAVHDTTFPEFSGPDESS